LSEVLLELSRSQKEGIYNVENIETQKTSPTLAGHNLYDGGARDRAADRVAVANIRRRVSARGRNSNQVQRSQTD
jgi:hypothetical protein